MGTTAYAAISSNRRRSVFLIALFVVVVGLAGWALSALLEAGPSGVVLAIGLAGGMSFAGYYRGDVLALSLAGAGRPLTKADNPYLWNMVENLCISTGLPMPRIYLLPDQTINAFATGRDPNHASIAVTVGAVERLENEELEGVLAHELSHIQNYDVRFMTLVAVLVGVLALLSDFARRSFLWGGNRRRSNDSSGGSAQGILMLVGVVLLILAPIIGQLIKFSVSRKREFLADASGALITRYPEGLARALEKIGADQQPMQRASGATAHLYFSNPFGPGGMSRFFSTHPPLAERIAALRKIA